MFSSNTIKFFLILIFALSFSSCGWWRTTESDSPQNPAQPFVAEEIKSAVPFQTKEPESYQWDLIITTGDLENRIFTARSGGNYRVDYMAANKLLSAVTTADGKSFLIFNAGKIYAETSAGESAAPVQKLDDWADFLMNERLNARADAKFTDLGAENGLSRYRVNLGDSVNAETIVFVDENIKLPVRQEFYSISGDERSLVYKIEMRNLKLQTDAELFRIPADYKRVPLDDLRAVIKKENADK